MSNDLQRFSVKIPGTSPVAFHPHVYPFTNVRRRTEYIAGEMGVNGLEHRVRDLERWAARIEERMIIHLAACERRSARLERLAWTIGSIAVSTFGATVWLLVSTLARNGAVP